MSANLLAPGPQAKRFAAYLDRLAHAAGHLDRAIPLKSYCTGLLLPGERKSVEPMAARLCPEKVRQTHQSLHHLVADAPWSDEDVLEAVRSYALPAMQTQGAIEAWIVDDTGFLKKGTHSVGVTSVLRAGGQARELPGSGESVPQHCGGQPADRLAPLSTGGVGEG